MSDAKTTKGIGVYIREKNKTGTIALQFVAATKKIIRTSGSFVTDGFEVGQRIYTSQGSNQGPFTIAAVSALEITVNETLVNAGGSPVVNAEVLGDLEVGEIFSHDGPGGSAEVIDVSHYKSAAREKRIGIPDEGQFSFEMNRLHGDEGQKELRRLRTAGELGKIRIVFEDLDDGSEDSALFEAFVMDFSTSGSVDERQTASTTLEISGLVTWTKDA